MSILSFLFGVATGIVVMLAVAASAAAMVARRFKRHPELLGRLIAKKAVGPALKRVS